MAMAVATATAHAADQWSRGGVPSPPPPDQLAQARDSDSGSHVGSAVTRRMRNRPVSAGAPGGAHSGHLGEARRQLGRRVARRSPYMTGARLFGRGEAQVARPERRVEAGVLPGRVLQDAPELLTAGTCPSQWPAM